MARIRLARAVLELGDREAARREVEEAAARLDVLLGKQPTNPVLLRHQWSVVTFLGDLALDEGRPTDALSKFEEARQLAAASSAFELADRALAQRRVAAACEILTAPPPSSSPSSSSTRPDAEAVPARPIEPLRRAVTEAAAAVQLDRARRSADPSAAEPQIDLAYALLRLAKLQLARSDASAARWSAEEATDVLRRHAAARPADLPAALALGEAFVLLLQTRVETADSGELLTAARAHLSQLSKWETPQSRGDAVRLETLRTSLKTLLAP
jgi:hypothetical protein